MANTPYHITILQTAYGTNCKEISDRWITIYFEYNKIRFTNKLRSSFAFYL